MPQFDSSTFASQIFWILVGFSLVYLFVSRFFTPKMKKVLSDRDLYIESILSEVRGLKSDADKIEKDSAAALEAVKTASAETESKLTTAFEEQSLKEKKALDDLFLKKTQEESDLLTKSSEKAFAYALDQMDEMVEAAAARILGSTRKAL